MSRTKNTRNASAGFRGMAGAAARIDRRVKPETRSKLIEAARHLFWERGFEATSLSDILQRSDTKSGSFYYFFKSKQAILVAVLQLYLQRFEEEVVAPIFQATSDPLQRIFGILDGYRRRLKASNCTYGCPIGRLALEIDPSNREVFALIEANFAQWAQVICKCLDDAVEARSRKFDHTALSRFVLIVMEGAVMQARVYGDISHFDSAVAQLCDYLIDSSASAHPAKASWMLKTHKPSVGKSWPLRSG
jgi:TetR/AcrR family transcriptional repressor of nem operon